MKLDHAKIAEGIGRPLEQPAPARVADVLAAALEVVRTTLDLHAVDVIDLLVDELQNTLDDLAAVRIVLSGSMAVSHQQHLEIVRQRQRIAELLTLLRAPR